MVKKAQEPKKGQQGVGRSFQHAYQGIVSAVRTQRNLRFHFFAAIGALIAGLVVGVSELEMAVLFLTIVVVFVVEMLNTALEFVVDLVTTEYHPLAKLAKDVSAGAVLVSSVGAVLVGLLVLADDLGPLLSESLTAARRSSGLLTLGALGVVVLAVVLGKALTRSRARSTGGCRRGTRPLLSRGGWRRASWRPGGATGGWSP